MSSRLSILLLFLVVSVGCTSTTSTILNRDDSDYFWQNSKHSEKGIPITVRVPTHVKIWIEEEYYIQKQNHKLVPLYPSTPIISVLTEFDYEEKLFTVDFKRPGAGTIEMDVDLEGQYFKKIHGKVVDNTIREVTDVVDQFAPVLGIRTSFTGTEIADNLIINTRTLAFGRFDINAEDFESQVSYFFDNHINDCHLCKPKVQGVANLERIPSIGVKHNLNSSDQIRLSQSPIPNKMY